MTIGRAKPKLRTTPLRRQTPLRPSSANSSPYAALLGEAHPPASPRDRYSVLLPIILERVDAIGWHPAVIFRKKGHALDGKALGCIVGVMTDPVTAKPSKAISRTYIHEGRKIGRGQDSRTSRRHREAIRATRTSSLSFTWPKRSWRQRLPRWQRASGQSGRQVLPVSWPPSPSSSALRR